MKKVFIITAAVAIAASCTKTSVSYESTEIGLSPVNYRTTKALHGPVKDNTYPAEENFAVFAVHTTSNAGTSFTTDPGTLSTTDLYLNGVEFTKDKSTAVDWSGVTAHYWPATGSLYFAGYSPYDITKTSATYTFTQDSPKLEITGFVQGGYAYSDGTDASTVSGYEMDDLMYFDVTGTSEDGDVDDSPAIVFNHALSYLTFKLSATASDLFTIKSVTLKSINNTGDFDSNNASNVTTNDPAWTNITNASDITLFSSTWGEAISTTDVITIDDVLIIPQDSGKTLEIKYTQKADATSPAVDMTAELTINGGETGESGAWLYNKHYTYTISFGAKVIKLTPSVAKWEDVYAPEQNVNQ